MLDASVPEMLCCLRIGVGTCRMRDSGGVGLLLMLRSMIEF